jgi:2-keto-4-pentenoate hydratase
MSPIDRTVSLLLEARRSGRPQPAPELPDASAAYAVQATVARELDWFAGAPRHWKSGGPSRDVVPTHAPLPPAGVLASPADASARRFQLRGIEAEVALRLRVPVDAARAAAFDISRTDDIVDAMCVSIELIDSRWAEGLQSPPLAKLADLQSHGTLVLGEWVPYQARDWAAQRCQVTIGEVQRQFTGSHTMGEPAWVLAAWLRHATRDGAVLAAGSVVTTGTWCGILQAQAGDAVQADFDGIGQARLQL